MDKIVYLPLDERPCNYDFPHEIFSGCGVEIITPPKEILSNLKVPADIEKITDFLLSRCQDAKGLVISADMLLYGGLVASRIHNLTREYVNSRVAILKEIKKLNPELKIFVFHLIMRCPCYSSAFEEPYYYGEVGKEINRYGVVTDLISRAEISMQEAEGEINDLKAVITESNLKDYTYRRAFNLESNVEVLSLIEDGTVDFLIIPQDDSAQYGFTILDQRALRDKISEKEIEHKILTYPGADEVGMVLISRMINILRNARPKVCVQFASVEGQFVVPLYEDIMLGETVKYQISAAGGVIVSNEEAAEIILFINIAGGPMQESNQQFSEKYNYFRKRNLTVMVEQAEYWHFRGKAVAIADLAYANGGDLELLKLLKQKDMLFKVCASAGWNTSSNSLGTTIATAFAAGLSDKPLKDFLLKRYLEDYGYCSVVRGEMHIEAKKIEQDINALTEFTYLSNFVREKLIDFADRYLGEKNITIEKITFPWRRVFEISFIAAFKS